MAYLASNERGRPVFLERSHYAREGRENPASPRRKWRLGPGKEIPFGLQIGPVLMLLAWVAGSGLGLVDPRILPAPWTIIATFGELIADGRLQSNFATSAGWERAKDPEALRRSSQGAHFEPVTLWAALSQVTSVSALWQRPPRLTKTPICWPANLPRSTISAKGARPGTW